MPNKTDKIPGMVSAFESFAMFVKTKWRATFVALIVISILGAIFLSIFYIYKRIDLLGTGVDTTVEILEETHTSTDQLQVDFEQSVENNIAIDQEMIKCVFTNNADSMVVFKFHDSRTDLQGKHDFFYSATNEISKKGTITFLPDVQNVPIVRLGQFITPMIEKEVQIIKVREIAGNTWLKSKLTLEGIDTMLVYPIYDRSAKLLGFTELIFLNDTPVPTGVELQEVIDCFIGTTNHIALIMQN